MSKVHHSTAQQYFKYKIYRYNIRPRNIIVGSADRIRVPKNKLDKAYLTSFVWLKATKANTTLPEGHFLVQTFLALYDAESNLCGEIRYADVDVAVEQQNGDVGLLFDGQRVLSTLAPVNRQRFALTEEN